MSERATRQLLNGLRLSILLLLTVAAVPTLAAAAAWQYYVPFETGKTAKDGAAQPGKVFLWLPPEAKTVRGVLVGGQLGIELEIALAPEVRRACAEGDLAIVYFVPHISGVFHYWAEGSTDRERWLKAFDDLARRSGRPELRRVPWITMGHSTAGIFCRNVAYAWPERVAGVLHLKSGNFYQKDHLPPAGSLAGIPLATVNGQFETFGPEGGIRPEFGRETQWVFVRKDIEQFREKDPNHLMSLWLDLGGDHFHGSPELSEYATAFLRKTAKCRIPHELPAGNSEVPCLPLKPEDGWLTDPDLYNPTHPPAAYKDYTGDKRKAMWHYDREMAEAAAQHHKNLGNHQCLGAPALTWLEGGDGWTFRAKAEFLDTMPEQYGGSVTGKKIGHAAGPILYRAKINEPVRQVGPDTFRVLRPGIKAVNIAAVHPGDGQFRATHRWASLTVPAVKGQPQSIDFPPVPDQKADGGGCDLKGRATSGLLVFYEVDYGPVAVKDGRLTISDLPHDAQFPIECRVTAYQIGRRTGEIVAPAPPVSQVFNVVKP